MPKRRVLVGVGWSSFYFGSEITLLLLLFFFFGFTLLPVLILSHRSFWRFSLRQDRFWRFSLRQDHHLNLGLMAFGYHKNGGSGGFCGL